MDGAPPSYEDAATTKPPYPTGEPTYPTGNTAYPPTNQPPGGPVYPPTNTNAPPPPTVYVPPTQATVVPTTTSTNTVIVSQPTPVFVHNPYGYIPASIKCPNCQQNTVTQIEYRTGGATWLACGITCLVGCWLGCCLIPFCIDALKDVVHRCGHCHQEIGYRKRLS